MQPSGVVIVRSTSRLLMVAEKNSKVEEEKQKIFLHILHKRIGTSQKHTGTGIPSNRKANA